MHGKTKAHCSKESTGPTVSSRVGEPNRLHAKKLSRLSGLPYLTAEARQLASPSCLALPSCLTPVGDSYMEQTGMLVGNFEFNP